jgi:hypothetical protein
MTEKTGKNNSIYLSIIVMILVIIVGAYRTYEYIVRKNFIIEVDTVCNPEINSCFSSEELNFGQNPYEKVKIMAKYADSCLYEHTCEQFSCGELSDESCEITFCSDQTVIEGETCVGEITSNK